MHVHGLHPPRRGLASLWLFSHVASPPVADACHELSCSFGYAPTAQLISPFTVYFNSTLIVHKLQLWRLLTNFLFFGNLGASPTLPALCPCRHLSPPASLPPPGLDFLFHMFFLARYCRLLEEGAFRGRTADFLYMLLVGASLLTCVAPFVHIQFLGSSLAFMLVYVWGRRNAGVNMSFLGLFNFSAPYLPWVLLAFSYVLGSSPLVDILGIGAGHTYYYLTDVYPHLSGRHLLATPRLLRWLLREHLHAPTPAQAQGEGQAGGRLGGEGHLAGEEGRREPPRRYEGVAGAAAGEEQGRRPAEHED